MMDLLCFLFLFAMTWANIQSTPVSRMKTVMHLNKRGFLVPTPDLGIISKDIQSMTIAILAAVECIPDRQERILSSAEVDEDISKFAMAQISPGRAGVNCRKEGKEGKYC